MKKIIIALSAIASIALVSCNGTDSKNNEQPTMDHDSMPKAVQDNTKTDNDVKLVSRTFTTVDPGVSTFMKAMVGHYLAVKNALANDNETEAAAASDKMHETLKSFDKSLLSGDQKKQFDGIESNLKEQAAFISKNKIESQREHFVMMSKGMYEMTKAFGAGMTLYHDHCPMYKDGSMWLSESKDIKNPYYGEKMMTCGSVEEMLQ